MEQIDVQPARTHLLRLLDRAYDDEVVILSKNGEPEARLRPLEPPGSVEPAYFAPLPEPGFEGPES